MDSFFLVIVQKHFEMRRSKEDFKLPIGNVVLDTCSSCKTLGVVFDSKFTYEKHIRSLSSCISQKIGLLRKSHRIFGDFCFEKVF